MQEVNLGFIGCGTVGGGVLKALEENGGLMASRLGIKFNVTKVAVRDLKKARAVRLPAEKITTDWREVVKHPDVDVVIELMGGTMTARQAILAALLQGKPVVTANKALLSAHGEELFAAAHESRSTLYYEASVAGGIPIIKLLREALIGNRFPRIHGILNGTCNYILTRMKEEGAPFEEILADAQRLGYAEAEPSLDVDGWDTAHKAGILASLAHGFWVQPDEVFVQGIREVTPMDIQYAAQLGYTIKLLAIIKQQPMKPTQKRGMAIKGVPVQVTVYPTLIPHHHVLASINGVYNAVLVHGDVVGDTLYYGRGAGPAPTASAVLSDLADAALDIKSGGHHRIPPFVPHDEEGTALPIDEVLCSYYVRLKVVDKPGTLARIAAILGESDIGISSVIQPEAQEGESVSLILMIHDAANARMEKALKQISRLNVVKAHPVMFRVEHFE